VPVPPLNAAGDLPEGVHRCTQQDVIERFGAATARRRIIGMRLQRVLDLASESGHLARAIIFGSFLTDKAEPNDVDLFLVMDDPFDLTQVSGEARLVFDHAAAQAHFGASVFWVRRASCYPSENDMVTGWSQKRDGTTRGIVDILKEPT
jgi:hypothetical protein